MNACHRGRTASVAVLSLLLGACAAPTEPGVDTDDPDATLEPGERTGVDLPSPVAQAHGLETSLPATVQVPSTALSDAPIAFGHGCEQPKWSTDLPVVTSDGAVFGYTIAGTSDGGFVVSGTFHGSMSVGGEVFESHGPAADIFVLAFDSDTALRWGRVIGGADPDFVYRVRVDHQDNIVLAGRAPLSSPAGLWAPPAEPQSFVMKLDGTGATLWSRELGPSNDGLSLATGPDNEIVVAGIASEEVELLGEKVTGPYVLALDAAGQGRFLVERLASDLAIDAEGDLFVAAHGLAKLDSKGELIWERLFGTDLRETLVRVTSTGAAVVAAKLVGTADLGGGSLTTKGTRDLVVGLLNAEGEHVWSQRFGGIGNQWPTGLALDRHDRVLLTGGTSGWLDLGGGAIQGAAEKMFFAKLDEGGAHVCSAALDPGITATMAADQLAADSLGRPLLTGAFFGTFLIDAAKSYSSEHTAGFVMRY